MKKLFKYYHKLKICSQNSPKYKIYQQKIQYYLEGGCYFCHDLKNNPNASTHRSGKCTDPRNTYGKNYNKNPTCR
jgi:hypothetical protein